jgi:hypothetical protein
MADLPVTIELGLRDNERHAAGLLYGTAFTRKFQPIFGNAECCARVIGPSLNLDRAIVARLSGNLAGLAGFHLDGRGLVNPGISALAQERGWSRAFWGFALLVLLDSKKPDDVLVMDGITVTAEGRGQGIGTR